MKLLKERLKSTFINLCIGELAAVLSFWLCFFALRDRLLGGSNGISVLYPLTVLSIILVQGSIYWFILLKRLSVPQFAVGYTGRIYGAFKYIDIVLICLGVPVIIFNYSDYFLMLLAIFILAFALVEWINYYIVRLSYSVNPRHLINRVKNGRLSKSRLAKEIEGSRGFAFSEKQNTE